MVAFRAALTFTEQVDVTVSQQKVERLQVTLHVACAHLHHLEGEPEWRTSLLSHPTNEETKHPWNLRSDRDTAHLEQLLFILPEDVDHQQQQVVVIYPRRRSPWSASALAACMLYNP